MLKPIAAAVAFSAALFLNAQPAQSDPLPVTFTAHTTYFGKTSDVPVYMVFPAMDQASRPAMFIIHGSGGVSHSRELMYAKRLADIGVISVIPNHFIGRGVSETMTDQGTVYTDQMVSDVFQILDDVAKDARIDMKRVGIMGFSKGGTVSLHAAVPEVIQRYSPHGRKFALHIAFYPSCTNQYYNPASSAPVYFLLGAKDTLTNPVVCEAYAEAFRKHGSRVKVIVYETGQHAWDSLSLGEHWSAKTQNYRDCVFKEQADTSWNYKDTNIKVYAQGGVPNDPYTIPETANRVKNDCFTLGAGYGGDAVIKQQAIDDMLAIVKSDLLSQPETSK